MFIAIFNSPECGWYYLFIILGSNLRITEQIGRSLNHLNNIQHKIHNPTNNNFKPTLMENKYL